MCHLVVNSKVVQFWSKWQSQMMEISKPSEQEKVEKCNVLEELEREWLGKATVMPVVNGALRPMTPHSGEGAPTHTWRSIRYLNAEEGSPENSKKWVCLFVCLVYLLLVYARVKMDINIEGKKQTAALWKQYIFRKKKEEKQNKKNQTVPGAHQADESNTTRNAGRSDWSVLCPTCCDVK